MSSLRMDFEKEWISIRMDWDFEFYDFKNFDWKNYFDFEYWNEFENFGFRVVPGTTIHLSHLSQKLKNNVLTKFDQKLSYLSTIWSAF